MDSQLSAHDVAGSVVERPLVQRSDARVVRRIVVEGLFGEFDYDLCLSDPSADPSQILLLYGDNGSGKTTILRLLFHMLSPSNSEGHRNELTRIPFKKFEATLTDGTRIGLSRGTDLTGAYDILAEPGTRATISGAFTQKGQKEKKFAFSSEEFEKEFIGFLESLDSHLYMLPADRTIVSDELSRRVPKNLEEQMLLTMNLPSSSEQRALLIERLRDDLRLNSLSLAMQSTTEWIRNQTLRANARGSENANTIYVDIIKRIAASSLFGESASVHYTHLARVLDDLARRSAEYAKFGFTTPLQIEEILKVLASPDSQTAPVIESVLEPYINVSSARLDALEAVHARTASLINNLNKFYSGKTVNFDLADGFAFVRGDGQKLQPSWLSSGEQQLLLIFCYIVTCRDKNSMFIIDEPEISLNIKWKRNLISALLNISGDARTQFIFATHSMELLSEHLENVVKLEPMPNVRGRLPTGAEELGSAANS